MKIYILLILSLLSIQSYAQISEDCIITPTIQSTHGCKVQCKQLKKSEVKKYKYYCTETTSFNNSKYVNIDDDATFEKEVYKLHKENFAKIPTGFVFTDRDGKRHTIQKVNLGTDSKQYQDYNIMASVGQYLIIEQTAYEDQQYLVINMHTYTSYTLSGKPIFINENMMYSYGFETITIVDFELNTDVTITFNSPIINSSYSVNSSMGILFELDNSKCDTKQFFAITNL
ncbi:hypothetical protein [Kordia sp.]|uniref:hypothetical protein n=1 Tax=Kordia sp. TaxID=1965332 RepID=UPI003B5B0756